MRTGGRRPCSSGERTVYGRPFTGQVRAVVHRGTERPRRRAGRCTCSPVSQFQHFVAAKLLTGRTSSPLPTAPAGRISFATARHGMHAGGQSGGQMIGMCWNSDCHWSRTTYRRTHHDDTVRPSVPLRMYICLQVRRSCAGNNCDALLHATCCVFLYCSSTLRHTGHCMQANMTVLLPTAHVRLLLSFDVVSAPRQPRYGPPRVPIFCGFLRLNNIQTHLRAVIPNSIPIYHYLSHHR